MIIDKPITYYVSEDQLIERLANQITYIREAIKPTNDKSNTEIATFLTQHIFSQLHDLENYNQVQLKLSK